MLLYCLKKEQRKSIRKKTDSKNLRVAKTKNERIMALSNFQFKVINITRFNKHRETKELLSMIGKIPVLGLLLI